MKMQFPSKWSDKQPQQTHSLAGVKRRRLTSIPGDTTKNHNSNNSNNNNSSSLKRDEELKSLLSQCDSEHEIMAANNVNTEYDDSIIGMIKRQINNSRFAPATPEELQLDHVLSSVPYRDMLQSLFGTTCGPSPNLPIITKAYEESYMREAGPSEKQCAMGPKCECMYIDHNAPFTAVQFDLPSDLPAIVAAIPGETASTNTPKLCVLCSRKTTQKLFYDACYSGKRVQGVIQRYGNLCNQPGEYARECMLICPPSAPWHCLPLPIMSHQRNRYRVQIVAGVKHLQQLRVSHEDFFVSPPGKAQ
jgi:hypothetical protein